MITENNPKKSQLVTDIRDIILKAHDRDYLFNYRDIFTMGYLAAKYDLDNLLTDTEKLKNACEEYDKTDDLKLLDTIKETLIDLEIIKE